MVRVFIKLSDVSKCLCREILTISENMAFVAFLHLKNQTNSFDFIVIPTLAPDLVAVSSRDPRYCAPTVIFPLPPT
jgi:hypothetical protein